MPSYLPFPLSAESLLLGKYSRQTAEESVREHIQLMLQTWLGAYRYSPTFGTLLKQFDYFLPDADSGLKEFLQFFPKYDQHDVRKWHEKIPEIIENSINQTLELHEPRLEPLTDRRGKKNEKLAIVKAAKEASLGKREMTLEIKGLVEGKTFSFSFTFYLPRKPPID